MCGTGSQDFRVDDVFVPTAHTFSLGAPPQEAGPLYHPRLLLVTVWASTVANALGIARGAIESFIELATCTSSTGSPTLLRERPLVQTRVAEAEAILSAARAYVVEAVGTAWEAVCADAPDLSRVIAQARLAITHGMHEAVRAVDLVFHAAGTNAIYRTNPLDAPFGIFTRGGAAQCRVSSAYRISRQGVPGATPERHRLVMVSALPLCHGRRSLRQPEGHVHGARHRDGGGKRGWTTSCRSMPHACVHEQTNQLYYLTLSLRKETIMRGQHNSLCVGPGA